VAFWKPFGLVKVVVIAAVAAGSVARTASAQVLKGSFTLPCEVHWGRAMLPAGTYLITIDSVRGPALVTTTDGRGRCLVLQALVDSATESRATGLLISRIEGERSIRSLNWREGGRSFVYLPSTKTKHELSTRVGDLEAVPIATARK
jgi:hypothetical protein